MLVAYRVVATSLDLLHEMAQLQDGPLHTSPAEAVAVDDTDHDGIGLSLKYPRQRFDFTVLPFLTDQGQRGMVDTLSPPVTKVMHTRKGKNNRARIQNHSR